MAINLTAVKTSNDIDWRYARVRYMEIIDGQDAKVTFACYRSKANYDAALAATPPKTPNIVYSIQATIPNATMIAGTKSYHKVAEDYVVADVNSELYQGNIVAN